MIFCVRGDGWVESRGRRQVIGAGEAVIIPAGTPHAYGADLSDPWTIWWLHADGFDIAEFLRVLHPEAKDGLAQIRIRDVLAMVTLFENSLAAMERDETLASLYLASGATWQLLCQLTASQLQGPLARADRIRAAQDYLRTNLSRPVRPHELARAVNLSSSHFASLFRQATGTNVLDYVRGLRMARARELLLTTNDSVSLIASTVGYSDPFYFAREFRRVNGTPPTEFRKRAHQENA
ncbi:AraC family transcriptional regulator [Microbacterium panaciterrae]|uniref:AraC family transcriptional regulator n=1 Tax=Microbacterium panaciterrae TaxID=985759 RepID=A0ABP8PSN2_9MICO